MILHFLRSEAEDFERLTELCVKSKKRWGYPDYLIEMWKDELTITPRYIRTHELIKVENEDHEILAFGQVEKNGYQGVYEIKHLWIDPDYEGINVGKWLVQHLEKKVGNRMTIKVVPDPNAIDLFKNLGYHKVGEVRRKPDGMRMPVLKKIIEKED